MAADIKTRTATTADTDAILEFLRVNFPRRKLYYENRQFFLNEFQADDNMLNFWLAADESSGELLAVSSYYPANTKDSPDIISGIWYAKDSGPVMLGFLLRREMLKHLNARFFCGTTAVESSFRSHRSFAKWINPFQKWILRGGGYTQSSKYKELTEITAAAELKKCLTEGQIVFENAVEKDFSYFYRRYWQNPFLGYRTFSFQTDKGTESLVVLKKDSLK